MPTISTTDYTSNNLFEPRLSYKPFEYQEAYNFWEKQELSYWLWNEPEMTEDVTNWERDLDTKEKSIIGGILKGFAQTECLVNNYWLRAALWFPKIEVSSMCTLFAEVETRHAKAYNFLNETLDLQEYDAFIQEKEVSDRLNNLLSIKDTTPSEIAKSLAIFSGFCEGVSLFSAFAVLLHFSYHNKLKGMGKMIEWSSVDEEMHSNAGIWLFNTLMKENPELNTEELKESIYEGARISMTLEENYIDYVFKKGDIKGLTKYDLKEFVKFRANTKLQNLGYEGIFAVDLKASDRISSWFSEITNSKIEADFFANAEAGYSKRTIEADELDW